MTSGLYDAEGRALGGGGIAFTAEQAVAVRQREGPMLLSANAGSGKTAVLAERFVRSVLEDGVAPGAMLAITFTEKAAGELRARIRRRFVDLGARDAARDMDGAWISTVHGFCARILRAHAVTAGLDPAFAVLDEAVARQARAEAFTTALAAFLAPDRPGGRPPDDALALVATWGVDPLHKAIAAVHDELRSTGHTVPALPPVGARADPAAAAAALRTAWSAVDAERAAWRTGLVSLDAAQRIVEDIGSALETGDVDGLLDAVRAAKLHRGVKELKTDAVTALRGATTALAQAHVDDDAARAHHHLNRLLALYADAYAAAKRARSAVDYDDLELLANDLLTQTPAVAAAYRARFARIMVDEFQDTNPLQLRLVEHLDAGNVFLVGDALQSIYGFRHADVSVFTGQRRRHAALGAAPTLATNWRSEPALLSTLNATFGRLHEGYVPLAAGRPATPDGDDPRVELLLVDDRHDDEDLLPAEARAALQDGMPPARTVTLLAEARAVAARVRGLVDAGACTAGEVAVLLRAAADLHVYERALELEGLSTLASGGRGYWLRQQVQDLTSYLAALANPADEGALLSVLASPLVGAGSDALALLAGTGRARSRGLWATLTHGLGGVALADSDRAALTAFVGWFTAERELAPRLGLDVLIGRVVRRTGYDLHVLRLPGGRRHLANVHKLERLAAAFDEQHGRDVRAFIDHVTAEVEAEAREPDAPVQSADLDAVQLMTVHAAKGLEFAVVVVAGLGRSGQSGVASILVDGPQVGLRLPRLHADNVDALDFAELKAAALRAQMQEERRVMHVACTRAASRLILSGGVTAGQDPPAERAGGVPFGWLLPNIDAGLTHRLSETEGEATVDRRVDGERLHVHARLVAVPGPPADGLPVAAGDTRAPAAPTVGPDPVVLEADDPATATTASGSEQLSLGVGGPDVRAPLPAGRARRRRPGAAPTEPASGDRSAPPIATLSYSALREHAECGYRYYLRRVLRLPDQGAPAHGDPAVGAPAVLDPLVRGSIAHALLEAGDPAATTADDVEAEAAAAGVTLTGAEVDDQLSLVRAFAGTGIAARIAVCPRVRREEAFAFALDDVDPGGPLVNGIIDLVGVQDDGTWLIVDYKTNRVDGVDLETLVARDYLSQRRIYALAALRAGAPAVQVAYVFLQRPDEPVLATYGPADAAGLTAAVVQQAKDVRAGRFPVAQRPHRELCGTCPGRGGMCSWPEEMTLRPAAAADA